MKGYLGGIIWNLILSVSLQHKVVSFQNPFLELNRISDDFVDLCCPFRVFSEKYSGASEGFGPCKNIAFFTPIVRVGSKKVIFEILQLHQPVFFHL